MEILDWLKNQSGAEHKIAYDEICALRQQLAKPAVAPLIEALQMYANADFYFGCTFLFDRPTGGFDEDFTDDYYSENGHDYERPMPGKLALEAIAAYDASR